MLAAARCQRCGAPLDLTPETIVAVCSYCGFPNWTVQGLSYPITLIPVEHGSARRFFEEYLRSDPDMRRLRGVRLKSIETVYIPFYLAFARARTRYRGVAIVTLTRVRTVRENGETRVRTETRRVRVRVEGLYEASYEIPLPARRSVDRSYVDPLAEHLVATKPEGVPVQSVEWESVKGTVLASEVSPQDAEVWARDEACDRLQAEAEERMNGEARDKAAAMNPGWMPSLVEWEYKRIPCSVEETRLSPILLVPAVIALYTYQGGIYKAVFAGWDGRKVYSEEPLTPLERAKYFAAAAGAAGILGGGGAALALAGGDLSILGLLLFLGGAAASYTASRLALSDIRVERSGGEGDDGLDPLSILRRHL